MCNLSLHFFSAVKLIQLFCREPGLGNYVPFTLGETVIGCLHIAYADHISKLIPLIIRIKAVRCRRLLSVI